MISQLAIALSITKGGKWVIRYWFVRFVGINFFVTIALGACCFLGRRGSIAGCGDLANVIGSMLIIFHPLSPLPSALAFGGTRTWAGLVPRLGLHGVQGEYGGGVGVYCFS